METTSNDFKLWSPPLLDLSLDSFSNDLFQEFDKTRLNIQDDNETNQVQTQNKVPSLSSYISTSSITLPSPSKDASLQQNQQQQQQQQQQNEEEDSPSTINLFRKSSTFLKKKLSTNSSQRNSAISTSTTNNADDISNIVSRQYPPKPLQYSPIIDPPSDKISRNSRDGANALIIKEEVPGEEQNQEQENNDDIEKQDNDTEQEEKTATNLTPPSPSAVYTTASPPMAAITTPLERSLTSNQAAPISNATNSAVKPSITSVPTPTPNTPKRRSFFSLRFC
ncbi:hypothetical protein INT46_007021 [Mucor plumbeus]|uniref:Uncharacterized protein n=1 Tax=Mucor plumbeus TaxID=97098 RepID=A0A8H7R405_9FUNG|nr:hypothetical protein INT46_007021 [Mucor plumbeus]